MMDGHITKSEESSPTRMKLRRKSSSITNDNRTQSCSKAVKEDQGINILQLPEMVLLEIFSYLPVRDKCRSTRVCKTFQRVMKDSQLWKHVDMSPYSIKLQDLTKLMKRYFSKSLKHLEVRGFLWTTVKTTILSETFLKELQTRCPGLSKFMISNAELRNLSSSLLPKSLKELCLETCQVKENWLVPAIEGGRLQNLEFLDLSGCGRVTNRDVVSMAALKKLEGLSLMGCYRLSDEALETISSDLPHLKHLWLGHSDFTDKGIQAISQNLKHVTIFSIQNCEFLTNMSLKSVQRMKTIEELDISYNPHFDNSSVYGLVKALPNLKKITVQDVTAVRDTIMRLNPKVVEIL